jgi:hypothetical protein
LRHGWGHRERVRVWWWRRLVKLAVAAAITLAELVGLAFEIESPAD